MDFSKRIHYAILGENIYATMYIRMCASKKTIREIITSKNAADFEYHRRSCFWALCVVEWGTIKMAI